MLKIIKILHPQKSGRDYMIATFPTSSPTGNADVPILTKISPSAILFTRSAMVPPLKGLPVKSAEEKLPLATVPFIGAVISPSLEAL